MTPELELGVDQFFREPTDFTGSQGALSTLYLLRRDTSACMGINPNNHQPLAYQALFPATMAVLAGIDLVAKFRYGDAHGGAHGATRGMLPTTSPRTMPKNCFSCAMP